MKRRLTIVLVTAVMLSILLSVTAHAVPMPLYSYTIAASSSMSVIPPSAVYCQSELTAMTGVTRINAVQFLQKWNGSDWENVEIWYKSVDDNDITVNNYAYDLEEGTYRVKCVFTVSTGYLYEVINDIISFEYYVPGV